MSQTSTVFLIDDDASVLKSLEFLLDSHGLKVASFSSGEDFLNHYDGNSRGCVVTDVSMPGMNGVEVRAAILNRGWSVPVILTSGHEDIVGELGGDTNAVQDVIRKPIDQKKLINRIRNSMSNI